MQLKNDFVQLRIHPVDWLGDSPERFDQYAHYAGEVEHVTEFGVYTGLSTAAFLSGGPRRLISYDLTAKYLTVLPELQANAIKQGTHFEFRQGHSLQVDIEPTDLLFIDTDHTEETTYQELMRHHASVARYIMMHDSAAFPGVLNAAFNFMLEQPQWRIFERDNKGSGLLVLEKVPSK